MSAPQQLRLKRKRTENPPESLFLASASDVDGPNRTKRICYALQEPSKPLAAPDHDHTSSQAQEDSSGNKPSTKRIFHLKRRASDDIDDGNRKRSRDRVPVIEEQLRRIASLRPPSSKLSATQETTLGVHEQANTAFKRPSKGSAIVTKPTEAANTGKDASHPDVQTLADTMHQFALEQVAAAPPKPAPAMSKPRMSPQQSKARHEQRVASSSSAGSPKTSASDTMDTEEDYVYDTYVLTTNIVNDSEMTDDIAYLVINEKDDEYWHDLLAQVEAEEQEVSDEEDENAEDHYAADYPEDELASDDEYDNNAYNFRPRANSNDEQWDHREPSEYDSDSEDDLAEYDNYGNKGRMVRRWETILGMRKAKASDEMVME